MNQFNDDMLRCLFNKRYVDFKTCSSLRSVSFQFNVHAMKYFRSLKEFDLSVLKKNFDWLSESVETPYTCLIETVTNNCDNLEKVTGIKIKSDSLNSVSRMCLQKLSKLTSVVIGDYSLETTVLFNFLKQFPNLHSVKAVDFNNAPDEDDEQVSEEEKILVSELSVNSGDFWRIFRVDHLKKLEISSNILAWEAAVDTFCGVVERCQRLV